MSGTTAPLRAVPYDRYNGTIGPIFSLYQRDNENVFPEAVSYNRFVELESRVFFPLMFFLNLRAFGRCTGITFVDSTMIPVCHNLRRYANKVFKDIATDGKGTMGWCHGFKLHLACNDRGELIAFVLTGANVSDKDPKVFDVLAKRL